MRQRRQVRRAAVYTLLTLLTIAILLPYLWLVLTSFKTRVDAFAIPPKLLFSPTFDNYKEALLTKGFLGNLVNSTVVAVGTTMLSLLIGVPSAYSFSRFKLRGDRALLFYLLASRMLPAIVLALPMFVVFAQIGLIDTYAGIIIAHITFNLPFVVWMMKGFFDTVPRDLHEAAVVDGCSYAGAFARVALPITRGGLAATAIFCAISSWNEFLFALILTGKHAATLPVVIPGLLTPWGTYWGQIAAMGTVTTLPVLVFAFTVQKYLVKGMTGGAVRG